MKENRLFGVWKSFVVICMTLVMTLGYAIPSGDVFAGNQPGSMGTVPYEHRGDTTKWVTVDGSQKPVYCIQPTRSPSSSGWNANYRYRWNLSANGWLLDNNKRSLTNQDYAIDSWEMEKLAKILYVGYGHNAAGLGNGVSDVDFYKATQDAVFYIICYGKDNAPSYAGKSYKKKLAGQIVEAAKNVQLPSNYTLYMYIPDSDSAGNLQNTVNLEVRSTPPTPPTPSTKTSTVSFKTKKNFQGGELTADQFAFRFEGVSDNATSDGKKIVYTRLNDANGDVTFGDVTFGVVAEEFEFKVREVTGKSSDASLVEEIKGNNPGYPGIIDGVTYDETEYPIKVKTTKDGDGNIKVTVLDPKDLYLVDKTENGVEKLVELKGGEDITSKTLLVGKFNNSIRNMKTTVSAAGKSGSSDAEVSLTAKEAEGITSVTDTIAYSGLAAGNTYEVTGDLYEVVDGQVSGSAVATKTVEKTASASSGSWDIVFEGVSLQPGKKYVVFESAVNKEDSNDKLEHKDPTDKSQAITVGPKLSTTVTANGETADANNAAKLSATGETIDVTIKDVITYAGFTPGETVEVTWLLKDIDDDAKRWGDIKVDRTASDTGSGTWEIDLGTITLPAGDVGVGKRYIVYESALRADDSRVIHVDDTDNAQMIIINREQPAPTPKIGTTVSAGGKSATSGDNPKEVTLNAKEGKAVTTVTDTIAYEGLTAGTEYTIEGKLQEIENGAVKQTIATATANKTPSEQTGTWDLVFEDVTLEPGKTYVVYETATPAGGTAITHENPNDKAQTIVVEEEPKPEIKNTTINAGGKDGSDSAPVQVKVSAGKEVEIIDNVVLDNVKEGTYTLEWSLYDKNDTSTAKSTGTETVVAVSEGSTTTEINLGTVDAAGTYTIKTVLKDKDDNILSTHNGDFSANRETVTVTERTNKGKLSTQVSIPALDKQASSTAEINLTADEVSQATEVKDTITYEGMDGGCTYLVIGTLNEVKDGKVVKSIKTVQEERTATAGSGSWELIFSDVNIQPGKTYVVFEYAENVEDSDDNAEHKDATAKSQTIVTERASHDLLISKKLLGGEEVPGAKMKLTGPDGFSEEWTSEKTAKEFSVYEGDYTLTEVVAPKGLKTVTTKMNFSVDGEGKVTLKTTTVNNGGKISTQDGNHIVLEDAPSEPVLVKTVNNDKETTFKSVNGTVEFQIKATVPYGVKSFSIKDNIPEPLLYVEDSLVSTLGGKDLLIYDSATGQYGASATGDTSVEVFVLSPDGPSTIKPEDAWGKEVVLTLKCKIDPEADLTKYKDPVVNIALLEVDGTVLAATEDNQAAVLGIYDLADDDDARGANTGDDAPIGWAVVGLISAALALDLMRRRRLNS